ncbi:exodeoxyribonuclease V subunit beta [Desulfosudis oleivorans]|uniref:DNA 3'-5' helicase n=1 Tax=Desulfosudis oleivorans (strain DSM 6200 / JCM 39069 / Hxd3) TaxID=96561 RepID=A8ZX09_DESOH|nr:exodeoxyribonuclease V subunit beta [Desulfosudis oleivorans]ABW66865.1 exodeoxyribonuclease V, beta subunit [Desulfosudis oleivorans Hxd3]
MARREPFDILCADLSGGITTLVEASAGTGKTYAIVGLFLRLIAETDAGVDNILAVTYTEAATQELKGKIRTALRKAATAFKTGTMSGDPLIDGLLKKRETTRAVAARRLKRALEAFDQAAIFTIHGFCSRMLGEFAFESGVLFGAEMVTNQDELVQQVARDFWRQRFYGASPLFLDYAVGEKGLCVDTFTRLLNNWMVFPDLRVVPGADETVDTAALEAAFAASLEQVAAQWTADKAAVQEILLNSGGLRRNLYRADWLSGWFLRMDAYAGPREGLPSEFEQFKKFTTTGIAEGTKSGGTVAHHPFFDTCQQHMEIRQALTGAFDRRIAVEKSRFLGEARKALDAQKQRLNIRYFDDLLLNLDRVLVSDARTGLIEKARHRYRAVLIDEFQDTDPLQYRIFSSLFQGASALFFIGDPKQAIYGFRGADVFAYLEAVPGVDVACTLAENWRSRAGLVTGVNTLFQAVAAPFVFDEINFAPAAPASGAQIPRLTIDGNEPAALELRLMESDDFSTKTQKAAWIQLVARDTAAQAARLVALGREQKAWLGDRPLAAEDMAILVRRNTEAILVQEALSRLNVHSTILKAGDLFGSHEAFEMQVLLSAVAFAHDLSLVKGACATQMMGHDARRIAGLSLEADTTDPVVERFLSYRDLWRRHGFMKMFSRLLRREEVLPRLMAFPDGERRCTNLFHLAELLHRTALEAHYGPERLVRWLMRQRTGLQGRNEEHQLRLESDDSAVKIITIHKSKGLEYPVTFCPYLWTGTPRTAGGDGVACHEPREDGSLSMVLDLRSGDAEGVADRRERWYRETLSENMRLLYVALTRAKNQCYVSVVPEKADGSPLAALLGTGEAGISADALERVAGQSGGSIHVTRVGPADLHAAPLSAEDGGAEAKLSCRRFPGTIAADWRVASFSAMRRSFSGTEADHVAADDGGVTPDPELLSAPYTGIAQFPAGARAGLFMHEVFEYLDFTNADPVYREELVSRELSRYNFDRQWRGPVCDMVDRVLSTPLPPVSGGEGVRLDSVPMDCRINELEFFFPLRSVSPESLAAAYRQAGAGPGNDRFSHALKALAFSPARGVMRGFVDLVFFSAGRYFIVDWKSNLLGPNPESYSQTRLREVMEKEFYLLQAHLYAVALNQYLSARLPAYDYASDFGGVYYVFLRGVDPAAGPDYGIYRETPSVELMRALTRCLLETVSAKKGEGR